MPDYGLMPKFEKPLVAREVRQFMNQFNLWASQQKLTEAAKKSALALAFTTEDAKHWFALKMEKVVDTDVTYSNFVKSFLEEYPLITSSGNEVFQLLSEYPRPDEKASSYILRLRYKIGEDWTAERKEGFVDIIIKNLPQHVAAYTSLKGEKPTTFDDLLKVVRDYESQGPDSRNQTNRVKIEVLAAATSASDQDVTYLKSVVQVLLREVAEIRAVNAQPANPPAASSNQNQQQQNPRRNDITCTWCSNIGHKEDVCRGKKAAMEQDNYRGGGRNFRGGRGYGRASAVAVEAADLTTIPTTIMVVVKVISSSTTINNHNNGTDHQTNNSGQAIHNNSSNGMAHHSNKYSTTNSSNPIGTQFQLFNTQASPLLHSQTAIIIRETNCGTGIQ